MDYQMRNSRGNSRFLKNATNARPLSAMGAMTHNVCHETHVPI